MTRFVVIFCLILAFVAAAPKRKKPTQSDGKIVGGKDTDINNVPYQVSLQYRNRHICGGSIIGPRHVLTAAHCVERGRPNDYSIRAGSNYHAGGGETRRVNKITRHPSYSSTTVNNDAAVLELSEPISGNTAARMVPLAESEPRSGDQVLVSGWGATKEGGTANRNLQSVTVPAITRQTCQRVYMRYNTITENMFCAGYLNGGRDACQGDSGGPAIVNGRQAGIVSWGAGCARRNAPGVYTNVASIRPWILQQTRATRKGLHMFSGAFRCPTTCGIGNGPARSDSEGTLLCVGPNGNTSSELSKAHHAPRSLAPSQSSPLTSSAAPAKSLLQPRPGPVCGMAEHHRNVAFPKAAASRPICAT